MKVVPYKGQAAAKKQQIEQMFDGVSHRYDFLNHLLSGGIDVLWRRKALRLLRPLAPQSLLDIATGTGDVAIEAARMLHPGRIVGLDLSEGMLTYARRKVARRGLDGLISFEKGDAENLRFESNSFDAVTVSYGVRNFENLEKGLAEMYRVLRPGGTCIVLEFSKPRGWFRSVYNFYFKYITPTIGGFFSKDRAAYTYLPESVGAFPDGQDFLNIYQQIGFTHTQCIPLTFGVSSIYVGKKPL